MGVRGTEPEYGCAAEVVLNKTAVDCFVREAALKGPFFSRDFGIVEAMP